MSTEFYIPKMSDHMEQGVFIEWLVAEGDAVNEGQPILIIDTDKVVAEVDAPASGFLKGVRPGLGEGVTIAVGETVAFIVEDMTEEVPVLTPLGESGAPADVPGVAEPRETTATIADQSSQDGPNDGAIRATPAGRRAARELDIALASVPGSGPGGRVSERDVRQFAEKSSAGKPSDTTDVGGTGWLELTRVQEITARRMVESTTTVPQFALTKRLDVTAVLARRNQLGAESSSKPSITAYLVKAAALALAEHPRVNGFFRDGRVELNPAINVGVAIGVDYGLIVPVIHKADGLSVTEIADRLANLRALADRQALGPGDLEGGTFTLSNLGMFGVDEFHAIVNPPQSTILATGSVSRDLVVDDAGAIRIRDRMPATVTADHRSLDGVAVARFLTSISEFLESDELSKEGST